MTREQNRPHTVPDFANREEMAAWFDTHDTADYEGEFKPVEVRFAQNLSEGLHIRLDKENLAKLRQEARTKGISPSTLVRMWVLEHLQHKPEHL